MLPSFKEIIAFCGIVVKFVISVLFEFCGCWVSCWCGELIKEMEEVVVEHLLLLLEIDDEDDSEQLLRNWVLSVLPLTIPSSLLRAISWLQLPTLLLILELSWEALSAVRVVHDVVEVRCGGREVENDEVASTTTEVFFELLVELLTEHFRLHCFNGIIASLYPPTSFVTCNKLCCCE